MEERIAELEWQLVQLRQLILQVRAEAGERSELEAERRKQDNNRIRSDLGSRVGRFDGMRASLEGLNLRLEGVERRDFAIAALAERVEALELEFAYASRQPLPS
jgi:small-conductance mechanosensitive channel